MAHLIQKIDDNNVINNKVNIEDNNKDDIKINNNTVKNNTSNKEIIDYQKNYKNE